MIDSPSSQTVNNDGASNGIEQDEVGCSFLVALALIVFAFILTVGTWYIARRDGHWPVLPPERWAGNHGPWRHYDLGLAQLNSITAIFFFGSIAALVSVISKPRVRTGILLAIGVFGFWEALGWSFYLGD